MSDQLSNFDERYTCPSCVTDIGKKKVAECPHCQAKVDCFVDTVEVFVCRVREDDPEDHEEEDDWWPEGEQLEAALNSRS